MRKLTTEEFRSMQEKGTKPPVINVLDRSLYQKEHIPGSDNVPLEDDQFVDKVREKAGDKTNPVIVYCASTDCDASIKAAERLEEAGFTNVYDYEGGTKSWKESGQPVEAGA